MSQFRTFWLWIKISRLGTWAILPIFFLLGLFDSGGSFSWQVWLELFALSFPLQLFINSWNDIFDIDSDSINPRKNNILFGLPLAKKNSGLAALGGFFGLIVVVLSTVVTGNFQNIFWTMLGLIFGLLYSLPPVRLKERPILGLPSYSAGFLSAYFMGFTFGGNFLEAGIKPWVLSLLIVALGCMAFLADYSADLKAKQRTIATVWGQRTTAFSALFCYVIVLIFRPFESFASLLYTIFGVIMLVALSIKPTERLAKISLYSLAFFGGVAIILATFFNL